MTTPVPVALAELAAEVDELAGAVVDAIVGAADNPPNIELLGVARQRAEDVQNAIREMTAQWKGEE